jgi:hypothetical protein
VCGSGVHAEFVSQHLAQLMVGAQRRGGVAVGGLRLHEQSVARLGERRFGHERSGGSLSSRQLGAADAETGLDVARERPVPDQAEAVALDGDPRRFELGQEGPAGGETRAEYLTPRPTPLAQRDR